MLPHWVSARSSQPPAVLGESSLSEDTDRYVSLEYDRAKANDRSKLSKGGISK